MRWPKRRRGAVKQESHALAFPYYVDSDGLRSLANSLGIDLPLTYQKSSDTRMSVDTRGIGGERTWHQGSTSEGHIHLNHLAAQLRRSAAYQEVVDVLGLTPPVRDQSILQAALRQIEYMPSEGERGDELSIRLRSAYEAEQMRAIAQAKREELKQVAIQNQLVILRGTFETTPAVSDHDAGVRVRLTGLERSEVVYETIETPGDKPGAARPEMLMPNEVGIEAVLPSDEAFTASGRERLGRGAPFYGRLIAHSASFDERTGILTCSAYAVWGMPRPTGLLEEPRHYDFLEER